MVFISFLRRVLTATQAVELRSKHGVILSCTFTHVGTIAPALREGLDRLATSLEEQKYGSVDEGVVAGAAAGDGRVAEVWEWLKSEMDS